MKTNHIYLGNAREILKTLPSEKIDLCITSPPYWSLRDYGVSGEIWDEEINCDHSFSLEHIKRSPYIKGSMANKTQFGQGHRDFKRGFCKKCKAWKGQLGLEPNFDLYIKHLCDIFEEVKRTLKKEGGCWVNLGDTYSGSSVITSYRSTYPKKSLIMIPFRFAIEMVNRGWILRNVIIWHKPNAMPCSVKDRFTVDFEYFFFFVKNKKYYFKQQKELSSKRNKRCVWPINTKPFKGDHSAVYPPELIETPIKSSCPQKGIILDPFMGSGTTALEALKQDKKFIGIELNEKYIKIAEERIKNLI